MEGHYGYRDLGYGVLLTNPEGKDTLLQGDDAENFLDEIADLNGVWESENPNPHCFSNYKEHLDIIIEPYFF